MLASAAALLAGCTSTTSSPAPTTQTTITATTVAVTTTVAATTTMPISESTLIDTPIEQLALGQPGCHPSSPLATGGGGSGGGPETRGTTRAGVSLFGLVLPSHGFPLRVGDDVKVVWRMSGTGALTATLTSPAGLKVPLSWGPVPHDGSLYNRPGDEWGVGYRFTQPGCWHLHLARTDAEGDVWFDIRLL